MAPSKKKGPATDQAFPLTHYNYLIGCCGRDLIGAVLVPDALKHVVKTALDRLCGDDDGRLQSGEFAGAARQLAVVGLPRQKVAFFKYLVIVGIGVGAITMRLDGLAVDQPTPTDNGRPSCSGSDWPVRWTPS